MLRASVIAMYNVAKSLYPKGCLSKKFVPITVEGHSMELRYSTDRGAGDDVEFNIFFPGNRYSRYTLIVYADGRAEIDNRGIIPEWDRLPNEPVLTSTPEELLQLMYDALLAHEQKVLAKRKSKA
jgi:hypothetical protein